MLFRLIALCLLMVPLASPGAHAAKRIALLIGNQDYRIDSLDLKNPHNDVTAVGRALKQVGFDVRIVKDAGFGKLQKEVNRYAKRLRRAGKGAVGFFYYSGHGALNESNRFNYLIPTDVDTVDSADLWDGSIRLKRIVDDLKDNASNAVHFVVFDACRNELKLSSRNSKSLLQSKGFRPIRERVRGMLIAYATAEGEIASDVGSKVGPYAEALSRWITKPGVEAVTMFREVQVSVFNNIGQEPWYTHGALRRVYFASRESPGRARPGKPKPSFSEAAKAWALIETSKDVRDFEAFRRQFGNQNPFYDRAAEKRIAALNKRRREQKNDRVAPAKPSPAPSSKRRPKRKPSTQAEIYRQLEIFGDVLERVRSDYVDKPDDQKLINSAIASMLRQFPSAKGQNHASRGVRKAKAAKQASSLSDVYRYLDLFGDVLEAVRTDHPGRIEEIVEAAIRGMLADLDPHSAYLDAKRFRNMQVQTRGQFGGLGIEVTMSNGVIKVIAPIEDSPADKAGIQASDLITHLDSEQIVGLTLEQAVQKMRGPVNRPITLTVIRKGRDEPFDVRVVRDVVRIKPVKSRLMSDGKIGYLRITAFQEQTHVQFKKAIASIKREAGAKLKGYVLDLRNNPGGLLDQAIAISDSFLSKGSIVLVRGRDVTQTQRHNAKSGDLADGKPVVVLINNGSGSAAEIVAGALQDHRRATIIGLKSAGKGSVQTIMPLAKNGALRLTTARYYTPSGRSIQAKAIEPNLVVERDGTDDNQLKRAIELIRQAR